MDETIVTAYLGIPMPSIELFEKPNKREKARTVLYDALGDLTDCSNTIDFRMGAKFVHPEIQLLDKTGRESAANLRLFQKKQLKYCELVTFSASVPLACYNDIDWDGDDANRNDALRALARVDFCKRVSDVLVMSNIARVGAIELSCSAIAQDGSATFGEIPAMQGFAVQRAAEMSDEMGWPPLEALSLQSVWSWAVQRYQILDGFDNGATGRALCAFSRLFEHRTADEPMQLLWALVGLEALYRSR